MNFQLPWFFTSHLVVYYIKVWLHFLKEIFIDFRIRTGTWTEKACGKWQEQFYDLFYWTTQYGCFWFNLFLGAYLHLRKEVAIHNFLFPQWYHYVIIQGIYHCIIGSVCEGSVTSFQTPCKEFYQSAFSVEDTFHYNI